MYKITLVKSLIGKKPNQVATAKALGLIKLHITVKNIGERNWSLDGDINPEHTGHI